MSFFKFWEKNKSTGKGKKEKENSQPKSSPWPELSPEEQAEAAKFPFAANKRDKNLSMSRSGRYKYRAKQRGALVGQEEDIYSTHRSTTSGAAGGGPSTSAAASGNYGKASAAGSSSNSGGGGGSVGRKSNQGSLGRSSAGGQCAVETSSKRSYPGQNKMPGQPTAV